MHGTSIPLLKLHIINIAAKQIIVGINIHNAFCNVGGKVAHTCCFRYLYIKKENNNNIEIETDVFFSILFSGLMAAKVSFCTKSRILYNLIMNSPLRHSQAVFETGTLTPPFSTANILSCLIE